MDKETIIKNSGLSDKEARTYLAILELGSSTIKPIAVKAGLKRTSLYNFIDHLVSLGLVTQSQKRGGTYYSAQPPEYLVNLQKQRFESLNAFLPELRSMFNASTIKPKIYYYEGKDQTKNIFQEVLQCRHEVLHLFPGSDIIETIGGVDYLHQIDLKRIELGISIRTIRFKEKDVTFPSSAHGTAQLRQLRWAPEGFQTEMGMGIYDTGKVSFWSSQKEGFGIVIESHELMILAKSFYELLWMQSEPAKPGQG